MKLLVAIQRRSEPDAGIINTYGHMASGETTILTGNF
jgi:hypothetical protein